MSIHHMGISARYIAQTDCIVRKRWTHEKCLHIVHNTCRFDKYKTFLKETEFCNLTKPATIVGITIKTGDSRARRGIRYYVETKTQMKYLVQW